MVGKIVNPAGTSEATADSVATVRHAFWRYRMSIPGFAGGAKETRAT
jgi:hypothetical protein